MRYIAEYYSITVDEYAQECKMLNKDPDIYQIEKIHKAISACEAYKKAVTEAAKQAYKEHIEPHLHQNIVYSRTWGKY